MGTSLHVGGLVTLVAAVHYMYMREYWVQVHNSPIVYRYVDWSITVPLQMIEFNLILKAAGKPVSGGMFWRLLGGTVLILLRTRLQIASSNGSSHVEHEAGRQPSGCLFAAK